jgi:hypothetical protein
VGEKKRKEPVEKQYGWYSQSQAEVAGVAWFLTPSGESVAVTCVTSSPNDHGAAWKDIALVGEVTRYIKTGEAPRPPRERKPPKPPTRQELVSFAMAVVSQCDIPRGGRMVVVVTDEEGAFLGVASNTMAEDQHNLLERALKAEGKE